MKCPISIGQLDKNVFYPILGGLANFGANFIISKSELSKHPIILSIGSTFGMSLSFILLIIYKCKNKSQKIESSNLKLNITEKKEKRPNKFKYILLTVILDFIETILVNKFCKDVDIHLWIFDILFVCLFSYLIFNIKIYRHHYLSIIIIILTGIILDSIEGLYKDFFKRIVPIIIKFFLEITMSFDIIINKYIMEKLYTSTYEMCFYIGISGLVLYSILLVISKYYNFLDDFFKVYKTKNFGNKDILIFSGFIINKLIYNLFMLITIKNSSSCHFLIILIIGELAPYIQKLIKGNSDLKINITIIVGLCFVLFMTLVFNEVIELNCFGLEENTKKNISIRVKIEEDKIDKDDENDSKASMDNYNINIECEFKSESDNDQEILLENKNNSINCDNKINNLSTF